jgi:hypothetical protein
VVLTDAGTFAQISASTAMPSPAAPKPQWLATSPTMPGMRRNVVGASTPSPSIAATKPSAASFECWIHGVAPILEWVRALVAFGQSVSLVRLPCIAFIVVGIVGWQFTGSA